MIYALTYLIAFALFMVAFAIRTPDQDVKITTILALFWPVSIVVLILFSILWAVSWDMDIADKRIDKRFQIRYPDDGNPGVAITLFHTEFQIWKKRK